MPSRGVGDVSPSGDPSAQTRVALSKMSPYDRERYERRLLRRLAWKHEIDSTAQLVKAYNEVDDSEDRRILLKWLEEFAEKSQENGGVEVTLEYTQLAKIKPRRDGADRLLRSLFSDLYRVIPEDDYAKPEIATALHEALLFTHKKIIEDDTLLLPLAEQFLKSLSMHPDLQAVDFEGYRPTFVALHLIVFYLRETCYSGLYPEDKRMLLKEVARKRQELRNSFSYYPLRFHFTLIEQSIQRLATRENCISQALRCVTLGYCGIARLLHYSAEPPHLSIEPEALKKRFGDSGKNAMTCPAHQQAAMICLLQDLEAARVLVVRGGEETVLDIFFEGLDALVKVQSNRKRDVDLKMLRFGALYELSQILIHGKENVQKKAEKRFLELTENHILEEGWINDDDIFEVFFEEALRIRAKGEYAKRIDVFFEGLKKHFIGSGKESISQRIRFDESLQHSITLQSEQEKRLWYEGLCCQVGKEMGYIPIEEIRSNIEYLKERYCSNENVTVSRCVWYLVWPDIL